MDWLWQVGPGNVHKVHLHSLVPNSSPSNCDQAKDPGWEERRGQQQAQEVEVELEFSSWASAPAGHPKRVSPWSSGCPGTQIYLLLGLKGCG